MEEQLAMQKVLFVKFDYLKFTTDTDTVQFDLKFQKSESSPHQDLSFESFIHQNWMIYECILRIVKSHEKLFSILEIIFL
jgi:hypothetical protein